MHKQNNSRGINQRGVVSFMVTLIMMMVISLIVIGFTQVTNRASRESLDRQLSSQAFYAAESGVNHVVKDAQAKIAAGTSLEDQTNCTDNKYGTIPTLSTSPDVAVTCLLVSTLTEDIRVSASQNTSTVVRITSFLEDGTPSNLTFLTFDWSAPEAVDPDPANCSGTVGEFAADSGTCGFGLLRVDILRPSGLGGIDSNLLADKTSTFYFQPKTTAPDKTLVGTDIGKSFVLGADCTKLSAKKMCRATLKLDGTYQTGEYYARLSTLYREAPVVIIDGTNNGGHTSSDDAYFKGSQIKIDSTGRAQDVLRRVQVRYPITPPPDKATPPAALQSGASVCKRFTVWAGGSVNDCP